MGFVKTGTTTTLGVIDPKKAVKQPPVVKPVKQTAQSQVGTGK